MASLDNIVPMNLRTFTDPLGDLVSLESGSNIDFHPKRVFYIFNAPKGSKRGKHSHKTASQLLIAISGKCTVNCKCNGDEKSFVLSSPDKALLIPPGIWAEQVYEEDNTVLMVISDKKYSKSDYTYEQ